MAELATLGGGCFWCLEAVFKELAGVESVQSGYAGGSVANPTYEQVCGKKSGHAEVVQVRFDPSVLDYADLLRVFFAIHDPTTKDRQGADAGPQYRSIILTHSDEQWQAATEVMKEVTDAKLYPDPLVTEVGPIEKFWPAEAYHDDYFARNPGNSYCRIVIDPKVSKFRKHFQDKLKKK